MQAEPEIRIVRRCRYQDDAHWNYPVNLYPFDTFYFIRGGDGAVKVGNTVTNLEHGRVYLIPANTQYSCWCTTEIDKLYVEAYVEILPGLDVFFGEKTVRSLPFAVEAIDALIARNTENPKDALWFRGVFCQVASEFMTYATPSTEKLRFKPMLDELACTLNAQTRIEALAQQWNMSPRLLSRSFYETYGMRLKQYLTNLLLRQVQEQLLTTQKPLQTISDELGFCDAYYLSAFFKKHCGISPSAYRSQNGNFPFSCLPGGQL